MLRTSICASLVVLGTMATAEAAPITVTDVLGREVTFEGQIERIAIAEARQLVALSIVDRDVARKVVGMGSLRQFDDEVEFAFYATYPNLEGLPPIDGDLAISPELTIAADPDIVIMSAGTFSTDVLLNIVDTLQDAGIPSVFIDFRADPWENTIPSIQLLGEVLGQEETAAAYVELYQEHRGLVLDRIASNDPERPSVFMFMQASASNNLMTPGDANLGVFIDAAGGRNIGSGVVPGMFGALAAEYVLAEDPDIFIGTGGTHFSTDQGVVAGPGVALETLQESLRTVSGFPVLAQLTAVAEGKVHALWHNFHNSPLNIVAFEVLATWFHPALFADIDPAATRAEINERFLSVPFEGAAWGTLAP